jgi:formylglycine-generating enzyme required for sulfatase activity
MLLVTSFGCSDAKKKNSGKQAVQTQEKPTAALPKEITGKDGAPMVLIPSGEFQMGTDSAKIPGLVRRISGAKASWFEDQIPRHTVYLDAFYIDKHEVTNAQYRRFVQYTGHREPEGLRLVKLADNRSALQSGFEPWSDRDFNYDNQPVVCVSWDDARAYCEWVGKRLPTEAEWEKAARGGMVGKQYVWGDDWPPPRGSGNLTDETFKKAFPDGIIIESYDDGYAYNAPVGKFMPNGYGLYDMVGNVWEWCADWYDKGYYTGSPRENPVGPGSGKFRVLRGGSSYRRNALNLRVARRYGIHEPTYTDANIGFRCVAQD